jgi:hypothetical protein
MEKEPQDISHLISKYDSKKNSKNTKKKDGKIK